MALPDHFEGEDVIITFEKEYDSTYDSDTRTTGIQNVGGKVLSWNIGGGAQPTEDVYAFGGKTFNFQKPREKFTVSFEVMINNPDFDFVQFGSSLSQARIGNMSGKSVKSTDATKRWRIIFWFQEQQYHVTNSTKTVTVPGKSNDIYRMIFVDVKAVTFDKEFAADDYFKGTLSLEMSSADDKGYPNFIQEEGIPSGTTTATALGSLTTSVDSGVKEGLLLEARGYMDWTSTTTPAWYTGATTSDVTKRYRYTG